MSGYVYLLQGPNGAFKIGKTRNWRSRRETFGIELPFDVEYCCVIDAALVGMDYSKLERELHDEYDIYWIRGEWFLLTNAQAWHFLSCWSPYFCEEWMEFSCKIANAREAAEQA